MSDQDENHIPEHSNLQLTVVGTSSAGFERKSTNLHDIQLHPDTLKKLSGVSEGDFIKIISKHDDLLLEFYSRVEALDSRFSPNIEKDEIGVGVHCRKGLAVSIGDTVGVETVGFEAAKPQRRLLNRTLKFRPASCRVRRSVSPDSGYKVCRLSKEVKDLLGIEWGDRVVVQSANGRIRGMKALPLREGLREKFSQREEADPDSYPPPFNETTIAAEADINVDIPRDEFCIHFRILTI
jgi:hypothetical protein